MSDSDIDALVTEATKGLPEGEPRKETAEWLNDALRAEDRPARPDFPEEWRSEPKVMFSAGDPEPGPFDWGLRKWATEQAYDVDLAKFLGDIACGRDVPEARAQGFARRALDVENKDRLFAQRLAARLIANCPPAKGLPEDTRRELEQLAARGGTSAAAPEASPPDPIE
jgi:hypothetical protein